MRRWLTLALALSVAATGGLTVSRVARADDPVPPAPKTTEGATEAQRAMERAESRAALTLLKATSRLMQKYLDDKQDPEKAAAYEDVFRALSGVLGHLDHADARGAVAAGMKSMLELMPTMKTPKRAEVMRGVLTTLVGAAAEGLRGDAATAGPTAPAPAGAAAPSLGGVLLGAVADCVLEEVSARTLFGAQLDAPVPGLEGFRVKAVKPGSRAAVFGLLAGDRIVRFGDAPASWRALFKATRALHSNGEFPPMTVLREGKSVDLRAAPEAPRPSEPTPKPAPK